MSNYTKTTDFQAKDSLPTGDSGKIIRGSEFETEFDAISTAIATKADTAGPTFTGTLTFETISDGTINVTAFVDEDDMTSNSATLVPTQQSVKAYVDAVTTELNAQDLDFQADSGGALSIDLDTETMTFTGGTGIDTSGSGNAVTFAIDSTVATLTGTQTLTNKTLTSPDVNTPDIDGGTIDGTVIGGTTPAAVSATTVSATGNITVGGTVDGRDVATDGTKLDTVETNADVTDTANVTAAGAVMDSELTNETAVKALDQGVATTDSPTFAGLTTTADVSFGDNDKAIFGAGNDLQIYHDGSNSRIQDAGSGNLKLVTDGAAIQLQSPTENMVVATPDADVQLYYNGNQKLATTFTGIDVTGTVVSDGLNASTGDITTTSIGFDGSRTTTPDDLSYPIIWRSAGAHPDFSSGDLVIQARSDADRDIHFVTGNTPTERMNIDGQTGDISFYEDTGTTAKLTWDASDEALEFADNTKATFGAGSDLQIYHDGNNSFIDDQGTGSLVIQSNGAYTLIQNSSGVANARFDSAGAASLRYNGAEKLATTSTGIDVTGTVTADGLTVESAANTAIRISDSTSANQRLDLEHNAGVSKIIAGNNAAYGSLQIQSFNGTSTVNRLRIKSSGDIEFYEDTGTTAKFFWDASAERLGIGNSAPTTALDVTGSVTATDLTLSDSVPQISLTDSDGTDQISKIFRSGANLIIRSRNNTDYGTTIIQRDNGTVQNASVARFDASGDISFYEDTGTTAKFHWDSSAESLGIGTSSPSSVLHLSTSNDPKITLTDTGFGASADITGSNGNLRLNSQTATIFDMADSEVMRIDSSGNVGIGTTTPSYPLTVHDTGDGIKFEVSDTVDANYRIQISGSDIVTGPSTSSAYTFQTGNTERMRIDTSGNLIVGGTTAQGASAVTLTAGGSIVTDGFIKPYSDDAYDLGTSSARWDDIFATNGTIQTSDRNEKQDIEELSDAEQRVAVACKGLLRKFRWKSSVANKGDEARIHFGIIAQDLQAAFEAEGLDAGRYAMFISTTWTDEETSEERTRMGVRYSELLAFIIAAI